MLAFYLAASKVENDRRVLNVVHGLRVCEKNELYGKSPSRFRPRSPFY